MSDRDAEFWDSRKGLRHIRDHARSRGAAPWGTLGCVLARTVTAVDPKIVLPPLVGGHGSLNLFVGLVGPSGAGKGAAEAAASDALVMPHVDTMPVGSGEGLPRLFAHREKLPKDAGGGWETVRDRAAVLVTAPEVDTLAAVAGRQGATLLPELRKAWVGETLGFGYAAPEKQVVIERHTYRLTLVVGVQPTRARALLDDADGGTPQRILWLPVTDPDAPDLRPYPPAPMTWTCPRRQLQLRP